MTIRKTLLAAALGAVPCLIPPDAAAVMMMSRAAAPTPEATRR